jgi:competence protein ComEC
LGSPSFASIKIDSVSPVFIIIYYIVLALLIFLHGRWSKVRNLFSGASGFMKAGVSIVGGFRNQLKWAVVPLLVIAILVSYTAATLPDDRVRVSFLDVGQGDAILIQKGSTQILIDGGPSSANITMELSEQMPFWDRSIDLAILTHPHQDHLAGLLEVLRRYDVGQVLYPATEGESSLYNEWVRFIGEAGIKSTIAQTGQQIDLGDGVTLEVLWPSTRPITDSGSEVDNNSVVVLLKDGDISFLLTGDSMSEVEWELIRERADIKGTVIKVAHHGSASSTMAQLLAVVNPQVVVISVGANNTYHLPNSDVLLRLEGWVGENNVYRTDLNGTITFITDGEHLWVEEDR